MTPSQAALRLALLLLLGLSSWVILTSATPSPAHRSAAHRSPPPGATAPAAPTAHKASKAPKPRDVANTLKLAVVGDIMTHGDQLRTAYQPGCRCYRFRPVFREVRPLLRGADLTIGNLETTFPGAKAGYSRQNRLVFGSPDVLASTLHWLGFDVVSTANNHICDKGFAGLNRTMDVLDRAGIAHFGAYRTVRNYRKKRYLMLKRRGWRLAILSYTTHVNRCPNPRRRVNLLYWPQVYKDIQAARQERPDAIIILYHFGKEYARTPSPAQQGAVRTALRAGADLVLGSHTHTVQTFRLAYHTDFHGRRRQTFVAYSLGNFISNMDQHHADGGTILHLTLRRTKATKRPKKPTGARRPQKPTSARANVQPPRPTLHIAPPRYEPIWVYKTKRGKEIQAFHLLPVRRYLAGKGARKLPPKALQQMKRFYRDFKRRLRGR